jgi:hypothetical protein
MIFSHLTVRSIGATQAQLKKLNGEAWPPTDPFEIPRQRC